MRQGSKQACEAVAVSLELMANIGLFDHLAGGLPRY